MQTNIITYLCFFVVCGLVVVDMVFCSSVALQIVCILLVVCVVCLTAYIAHKWHKGNYLSNEQQSNLQSYLSENLALTKELDYYKTKQAKSKINGFELQNLVLTNKRLTAQITNLKTHLQTVSELLQNAKNQGTTVVLPISTNEQKPNKNRTSKTA